MQGLVNGMWRSLVSARRLGRRGRRFESGHPDEGRRPHMKRGAFMVVALVAFVATGCTPEANREEGVGAAKSPSPPRTPAAASPSPRDKSAARTAGGRKAETALEVVGHHPLGGDGYNADVYALGDFAYVGDMGHDPATGIPCPSDGVKVIDISNPSKPKLAAVLQNPDNTSAEDTVVRRVRSRKFQGDLAVAGIQVCDKTRPATRGLLFFDVTNPDKPKQLGSWAAPDGTRGCHEIDLAVRADAHNQDRVLVACANPGAAAGVGADEVAIVDASDPRSPAQVGGFTLEQDTGPTSRYRYGCLALSFAHSVRFFGGGKRLYVSYWDAGTVLLDVKDPARPEPIATTWLGEHSEDGDNHSMTLADRGRLLLINSEDVSPNPQVFLKGLQCPAREGDQWGQLSIYDNTDPAGARFIASFGTPSSKSPLREGIHTVHNTEVVGSDQAFSSWYSEGVRWIDLSNPKKPEEVARFLPPKMPDPVGNLPD